MWFPKNSNDKTAINHWSVKSKMYIKISDSYLLTSKRLMTVYIGRGFIILWMNLRYR